MASDGVNALCYENEEADFAGNGEEETEWIFADGGEPTVQAFND